MVRFEVAECDSDSVAELRQRLGVSDALAQVLVRRGFAEPESARAFLAAEEQHDPSAFAGMALAAERMLEHVRAGNQITVHGDYDVDGVCSTAVLVRALRKLGADPNWHLPDRAAEGYGLSEATVRALASPPNGARATQLLITVDCAITAVAEVATARSLGIEVIVTDHHTPRADGVLPQAPVIHPALCGYPCTELCATAVAYKLAQAVMRAAGRDPREVEDDLDLVALATIADVVALVGENRTLVRRGLRALAGTAKPGLRALMTVARVDGAKLNERAVGFALAPRINAAGRLYRADAALELILTEDPLRAALVAQELDQANSERRHVEQLIRAEAETQMAKLEEMGERSAYVLAGQGWHAGVIGIVAARLAEQCRRPVVLVSLEGEQARGSGRSVAGFDLLAGLDACSEHLLRHGGHSAAAGLELQSSALAEFAAALDRHAARTLSADDLGPRERVDAIVQGQQLGMELAEELAALAPFGMGNPSVSLMLENVSFRDLRPMGEGKHARFTVQSGDAHAQAVAFGMGTKLGVAEAEPARATFTLEVNEWRGVSEPRLVLRHAQSVDQAANLEPCLKQGPAQSTLFPLPLPLSAVAAAS